MGWNTETPPTSPPSGRLPWGALTGSLSAQADLAAALAARQPLDSDLTAIALLATTSYGRALLTLANQAALQAAVGVDLTHLNASYLTTGTIPDARFPAFLPIISGQFLTDVTGVGLNSPLTTLSFYDDGIGWRSSSIIYAPTFEGSFLGDGTDLYNLHALTAETADFADTSGYLDAANLGGVIAPAQGGTGLNSFTAANRLLYSTGSSSLATLATANNGVLVTDSGGSPSISSTLPAVSGGNLFGLNASNLALGTVNISRLPNIPASKIVGGNLILDGQLMNVGNHSEFSLDDTSVASFLGQMDVLGTIRFTEDSSFQFDDDSAGLLLTSLGAQIDPTEGAIWPWSQALYDTVNDAPILNAGDGELYFSNFGVAIFDAGALAAMRAGLGTTNASNITSGHLEIPGSVTGSVFNAGGSQFAPNGSGGWEMTGDFNIDGGLQANYLEVSRYGSEASAIRGIVDDDGPAVYGLSTGSGIGMMGESDAGVGLRGQSETGSPLLLLATGTSSVMEFTAEGDLKTSGNFYAVGVLSSYLNFDGSGPTYVGNEGGVFLYGTTQMDNGLIYTTGDGGFVVNRNESGAEAISGTVNDFGIGVKGQSLEGYGVVGQSENGYGLYGYSLFGSPLYLIADNTTQIMEFNSDGTLTVSNQVVTAQVIASYFNFDGSGVTNIGNADGVNFFSKIKNEVYSGEMLRMTGYEESGVVTIANNGNIYSNGAITADGDVAGGLGAFGFLNVSTPIGNMASFYGEDELGFVTIANRGDITTNGNITAYGGFYAVGSLETDNGVIASDGNGNLFASSLLVNNGISENITSYSSSSTIESSDRWITVTAGTTFTLPALNSVLLGSATRIKNGTASTITIQRAGSDHIYSTSSVTSVTLPTGTSAVFVPDGTYWQKF